MNTRYFVPLAAALSVAGLLSAPMMARAQEPMPVSIDLKDAPIRSALEQIFNANNIQYQMDNQVQGFVTLKIRDQPFENALKLIMRSATVPLTYTKENGVYLVKPRPIVVPTSSGLDAPEVEEAPARRQWETITLSYIDAADLDQLLGPFLYLRPFQRQMQQGGQGRGQGGGLGSGGLGGGGFSGGGGLGGIGGGLGSGGLGGGLGSGGFGGGQGGGLGSGGFGGGGLSGGGFGGGRGF